jgi:DNA-binding MarR family transcriptional regulator
VTELKPGAPAPNPLFLRDEELNRGLELFEAAFRALLAQPDRTLAAHGLGRNHRRVLYFVGREPGISTARLLDRLGVSKQSLSRLVNELADRQLMVRRPDPADRRQRRLDLTDAGAALSEQVNGRLRRRIANAYRIAGGDAVAGFHAVLLGLTDERGRRRFGGGP